MDRTQDVKESSEYERVQDAEPKSATACAFLLLLCDCITDHLLISQWVGAVPVGALDRDGRPAAQRIGVQRPATALTEPDPATQVCRQTAAMVN
jgi:hypothetical protein